jgi:photosystem II stability/assembly factor-like uncharacterized protein
MRCNKSNPTDSGDNIQYKIHTWEKVTNGLPVNASYNISSVESKIYAYSGYNLYSSSDNGNSWSPMSGLPDSTYVSVIAGTKDYLFAGTRGKGFLISSDLGVSWFESVNNDSLPDYVYSILVDSEFLYVGAGNYAEVYRSSDLGNSWRSFHNGFPILTPVHFLRINILEKNNNLLFACPFASGIYFSSDKGINWQSMNRGLYDDSDIWSFTVSDSFYFATELSNSEHGIYRYNFNGTNWTKIYNITDFNPHFIVAQGSTILASVDSGVVISFNNGNTWNSCNKGLDEPSQSYFYYAIIHNDYVFLVEHFKAIYRYSLK